MTDTAQKTATFGAALGLLVLTVTMVTGVVYAQAQPPRDLSFVAGRRLALVVGIDNYPRSPLLNARNDAQAMAAMLRELGFTVTLLQDISRNQMVSTVSAFGDQLRPEDVAFFFYAGHGLQIDGENYLVPADFDAASSTAARMNALPVGEIQAAFSRAKVSVLVLDACRNNPFSNTRGGRGLAPMEARGNIIAFATGAGQMASDNPAAANGLFTQQLLTTLRQPNLPLRDVFYRVRQGVYEATNGQQFPAVYDGLLGEVVLRPDGTGIAGPPVVVAPTASFASPPPVLPAPPTSSVATSAAAVPGEPRFELTHISRVGLGTGTHAGQLIVSLGRVQWLETPGEPKKDFTRAIPKDNFIVACPDIEHISGKSRYGTADHSTSFLIRAKSRNYDLFLRTEALDTGSNIPSMIVDAIRAACPAVKVK